MSRFDKYYRKSLLSKMFVNGWGNPDILIQLVEVHKRVSKMDVCKNLALACNIVTEKKMESNNVITLEGSFLSPFHNLIPGAMDENNRIARFQLLIPKNWNTNYKPLCIHFPGTGDHHYYRRKTFLANRLIKDGIASLLHINPFYGNRKPKNQKGSSLNYVSDLFIMGAALILETQVMLQWAKSEGFDPLAVHGISMGGHMASLGVSVFSEPVCLIPCLSWTTASNVFTQGAMSTSVCWDILSKQYHDDEVFSKTIKSLIYPPVPAHLVQSLKSDTINQKPNSSGSLIDKGTKPLDKFKRKFHFLIHHKHISQSNFRYYCDKLSNKEKFKFFSWKRPLELFSFMRSVTVHDKITNEELQSIRTQEIEMKNKLTLEKFFLKSIPADHQTVEFMRDLLDYFTHLGNYSIPVDTRLVTVVVADNDAYIPIEGVSSFYEIWGPQCDIRVLKGMGHVEAYLRSSIWTDDQFRNGIVDTMNRYVELYYHEKGPFGLKKS